MVEVTPLPVPVIEADEMALRVCVKFCNCATVPDTLIPLDLDPPALGRVRQHAARLIRRAQSFCNHRDPLVEDWFPASEVHTKVQQPVSLLDPPYDGCTPFSVLVACSKAITYQTMRAVLCQRVNARHGRGVCCFFTTWQIHLEPKSVSTVHQQHQVSKLSVNCICRTAARSCK